jgi:hypothetical protein
MFKNILLILFLLCVSNPNAALADCRALHGKELIEKSDIIFEGTPVSTKRRLISFFTISYHNYSTKFSIREKHKGNLTDTIDLFYRYSSNAQPTTRPIEIGGNYLVFALKHEDGYYYLSPCQTHVIRTDNFDFESIKWNGFPDQTVKTFEAVMEYPTFENENIKKVVQASKDRQQRIKDVRNHLNPDSPKH